jgi:hypothetical protein
MHDDLIEGLIIGTTIGLVVFAIRVIFVGTASMVLLLALALAGLALCAVQILLSRRRARQSVRRPRERPEPTHPLPRRRLSRHNPFAQELTHNWTGLNDHLADQDHPEDKQMPRAESRESEIEN